MQVALESPSALERQFTITILTGDVETEFVSSWQKQQSGAH